MDPERKTEAELANKLINTDRAIQLSLSLHSQVEAQRPTPLSRRWRLLSDGSNAQESAQRSVVGAGEFVPDTYSEESLRPVGVLPLPIQVSQEDNIGYQTQLLELLVNNPQVFRAAAKWSGKDMSRITLENSSIEANILREQGRMSDAELIEEHARETLKRLEHSTIFSVFMEGPGGWDIVGEYFADANTRINLDPSQAAAYTSPGNRLFGFQTESLRGKDRQMVDNAEIAILGWTTEERGTYRSAKTLLTIRETKSLISRGGVNISDRYEVCRALLRHAFSRKLEDEEYSFLSDSVGVINQFLTDRGVSSSFGIPSRNELDDFLHSGVVQMRRLVSGLMRIDKLRYQSLKMRETSVRPLPYSLQDRLQFQIPRDNESATSGLNTIAEYLKGLVEKNSLVRLLSRGMTVFLVDSSEELNGTAKVGLNRHPSDTEKGIFRHQYCVALDQGDVADLLAILPGVDLADGIMPIKIRLLIPDPETKSTDPEFRNEVGIVWLHELGHIFQARLRDNIRNSLLETISQGKTDGKIGEAITAKIKLMAQTFEKSLPQPLAEYHLDDEHLFEIDEPLAAIFSLIMASKGVLDEKTKIAAIEALKVINQEPWFTEFLGAIDEVETWAATYFSGIEALKEFDTDVSEDVENHPETTLLSLIKTVDQQRLQIEEQNKLISKLNARIVELEQKQAAAPAPENQTPLNHELTTAVKQKIASYLNIIATRGTSPDDVFASIVARIKTAPEKNIAGDLYPSVDTHDFPITFGIGYDEFEKGLYQAVIGLVPPEIKTEYDQAITSGDRQKIIESKTKIAKWLKLVFVD